MENYNDHKKYYHKKGNLHIEHYWLNNKVHRIGGPAIIIYDVNGNVQSEEYWLNGELHRTGGPARIFYYENGDIEEEIYYLNGEKLNIHSLEEFKKYQKTLILK